MNRNRNNLKKTHPSLLELSNVLLALHRQGYVSARGYSFAQKDEQFGKDSISVQAVAILDPKNKEPTWLEWFKSVFFKKKKGEGNR